MWSALQDHADTVYVSVLTGIRTFSSSIKGTSQQTKKSGLIKEELCTSIR